MEKKICLGTVKLGLPEYGFSSTSADTDFNLNLFLDSCVSLGINYWDTSPRYGHAEEKIGAYIKKTNSLIQVSTKIDGLSNYSTFNEMLSSVEASLTKLNISKIDTLYLHQNDINIISNVDIQKSLLKIKSLGLTEKLGVSLYSIDECKYAISTDLYDTLQVPISAFDTSFYNFLSSQKNIEIVARSTLLQGILGNRDQILGRISHSSDIQNYLNKLDVIAERLNLNTIEMCMAFVFNLSEVSKVIIGTTNPENLKMNLKYSKIKLPTNAIEEIFNMALTKRDWTNPRNWNK